MQSKTKLGAASLTLAIFISGCAPMPGTTPQASATGGYNAASASSYDYAAAPASAANTNTAGNYYDYGSGAPAATGTNTGSSYDSSYYSGSGSSSTGTSSTGGNYYDYSASGSSSGGSNGSATGSYAVQVIASPNRGTAEAMLSQMQSSGFTAVIDQVGGYYKVRIPYSSASEAKASLGRVRATVPDAFYTAR